MTRQMQRHAERRRAGRTAGQVRQASMSEPAGLPRAPAAPQVFNREPARNLGQPGFSRPIPALPDDVLIATLVDLGAPRWFAEQLRHHPSLRFNAVATWCLVQDAREGNMVQHAGTGEMTSAKDLVDAIRDQYAEARRDELISDRPDHTAGLGDR